MYTPDDFLAGKKVQEKDDFLIGKYHYSCWLTSDGYYFKNNSVCSDNALCFKKLKISNPNQFFKRICTYPCEEAPDDFASPYCSSLEDFTKILVELWRLNGEFKYKSNAYYEAMAGKHSCSINILPINNKPLPKITL